jgi:hypothetical protein
MPRPKPESGGEVEGEDADVGDRGEDAQDGEGADHGIGAHQHGKQPGDERPEHHDEQQQGGGDGEGFGEGEVLLHLQGDVGDGLGGAAGLDRDPLGRGRRVGRLEGGDAFAVVVLVAVDMGHYEGSAPTGATQRGRRTRRCAPEVGDDLDAWFGVEATDGCSADIRDDGVVHRRARGGRDEKEEVGGWTAEFLGQRRGCLGRLG